MLSGPRRKLRTFFRNRKWYGRLSASVVVAWTFVLGAGQTVTIDGAYTITKTTGVNGSWDGFFTSAETFNSGKVEITTEAATGDDGFFGLTDLSAVTGYTDVCGFWINGAGSIQIDNKGAISGTGAFVSGDTLGVEKNGSTYTILKNGVSTGLTFTGPAGAVRLAGVKGNVGVTEQWLNVKMTKYS